MSVMLRRPRESKRSFRLRANVVERFILVTERFSPVPLIHAGAGGDTTGICQSFSPGRMTGVWLSIIAIAYISCISRRVCAPMTLCMSK